MNINSILEKHGIFNIRPMSNIKKNTIAKNISEILCERFPDYFSNNILFLELSEINMYYATIPENKNGAKYFYKNNSIYFGENIDVMNLSEFAIHECIHYIQQQKNASNNLIRLGLYNIEKTAIFGRALNEAAVQLITCDVLNKKTDIVKYYDIYIPTNSETAYTLNCSLLVQMSHFTNISDLYNSTLFSNNLFFDNFTKKFSKNILNYIVSNMDILLDLETKLNIFINIVNNNEISLKKQRNLTNKINNLKIQIKETYYKTQNFIIKNCFNKEFQKISCITDLENYKIKLSSFFSLIGFNDYYNFFKKFSEEKEIELLKLNEKILKNALIPYSTNKFFYLINKIKTIFLNKKREGKTY